MEKNRVNGQIKAYLRFLGFVQSDGDSFHLGQDSARVFVKRILCLAVLVQPLGDVRALPDKYRRM